MFGIFSRKNLDIVGIDISSDAVKVLELAKEAQQYRVMSYAVAALPAGTIVDKEVKHPELLVTSIQDALSKAQTQAKLAAISLPDSLVITKVIQLDSSLSDEEIENQIAVEADKYIPYPLEEVSLDFTVLGPVSNKENLADVLLAASRRTNVDSRVEALAEAGLTTKIVDVESYAIERACQLIIHQLPNRGLDQTIAVIDFGSQVTHLIILQNMQAIFARHETFGGKQLTEAIQRHYGLNYAEAGLAKKTGNLPEDYIQEVLNPFKKLAIVQVRRALQFFFSSHQEDKIHHIILAGGTVKIPGLAEEIEQQIGISTLIANPFEEMLIAPHVNQERLKEDASALMVCCGLALRKFQQEQ